MKSYRKKLYDEYLKSTQNLCKLESERKLILFFIIFIKTIVYLALAIFAAYFISQKLYWEMFFAFCMIFLYIQVFFGILFGKLSRIYKRKIKNKCFARILKCFDFIKDDSNNLFSSLILKKYIKYSNSSPQIDDRFTGTYNNVNYRIAEIGGIEIRGYKGVYSSPWFGVFIEMQFNKEIKASVYIFSKSEKGHIVMISIGILALLIAIISFCFPETISFGIYALIFSIVWSSIILWSFSLDGFQKVNLEDVKFAKSFNVETTDQVAARYILTTAFMDRINNLKRIFNSKDIRIFFENNKMTIAIGTTKDLFEIGDVGCSIHDFKQINQFYEEITAIISFIEYFKLTNRTGL